jgi:hypothetical protein
MGNFNIITPTLLFLTLPNNGLNMDSSMFLFLLTFPKT